MGRAPKRLGSASTALGPMTVNESERGVKTPSGSEQRLGDLGGEVLLIVNVAAVVLHPPIRRPCSALSGQLRPARPEVLGFPCTDFGAQEARSLSGSQRFCATTYGANFTLFEQGSRQNGTRRPLRPAHPGRAGRRRWVEFSRSSVVGRGRATVLGAFKSAVNPDSAGSAMRSKAGPGGLNPQTTRLVARPAAAGGQGPAPG